MSLFLYYEHFLLLGWALVIDDWFYILGLKIYWFGVKRKKFQQFVFQANYVIWRFILWIHWVPQSHKWMKLVSRTFYRQFMAKILWYTWWLGSSAVCYSWTFVSWSMYQIFTKIVDEPQTSTVVLNDLLHFIAVWRPISWVQCWYDVCLHGKHSLCNHSKKCELIGKGTRKRASCEWIICIY